MTETPQGHELFHQARERIQRGLLDLDHAINDYLGDSRLHAWVGKVEEATVRRVANHTSGLPLHYQFFYQDEPYLPPPMGETIRRYGHLVTAPGERFQYSNLGYGLLSEVIARLSGKSYAGFLHEEVFLPLGMLRASVNVGPGLEPYQAQRYGSDGVRYPSYNCGPMLSMLICWHFIVNRAKRVTWYRGLLAGWIASVLAYPLTAIVAVLILSFSIGIEAQLPILPGLLLLAPLISLFLLLSLAGLATSILGIVLGSLLGWLQGYDEARLTW